MDDERWAFEEELEQDDDPPRSSAAEPVPEPDRIAGRDQDGVVTVVVSPDADVLAPEWKRSVDPRGLHNAVAAAANAATIAALARQVDDVARNPPAMPTFGATPASIADESPSAHKTCFVSWKPRPPSWHSSLSGPPRSSTAASPPRAVVAMSVAR
ncbi:hypothetical protein DL991_42540 [Amycolatopsis sp. WAC 01375]|uniref:hypothetical protein n=1 Tax=Amycolatopsis sp. WAC 01375 TaxID=2203194 RepID=UPI000F7A9695|nr:hypothetical protein [Amycolatopsis sp. WAC 01375]RSM68020.1 hypothetical protein DL991_42540 [Amycolatopsis sp. WAC 01375]